MFEFGDELIINSHSIPWLIWIQLLAMLLLFILLYSFAATSSDLSTSSNTPSFLHTPADVSNRHNSKVRENERKETGPSTSTGEVVQRAKKRDGRPSAGSSTTNESSEVVFEPSHHPCHIFGLAKHAFLKCLGIDTTHEKND